MKDKKNTIDIINAQINDIATKIKMNKKKFSPDRFIIMATTGEDTDRNYLDSTLSNYLNHVLIEHGQFASLSGISKNDDGANTIFDDFKSAIDKAAKLNIARTLSKITLSYVFIQEELNDNIKQKYNLIADFIRKADEYTRLRNINLRIIPFFIILDRLASEKKAYIDQLVNLFRTIDNMPINAPCLLSDRNHMNFDISFDAIAETIANCTIMLSYAGESIAQQDLSKPGFTISFFSIKMPLKEMILTTALKYLNKIKETPDNLEKRKEKLGKYLSECMKNIFWKDSWTNLPFDVESINISPIYSIVLFGDETENRNYIELFEEKYYLSKLPVTPAKLRNKYQLFKQSFIDEYTNNYGCFIDGVKSLMTPNNSIKYCKDEKYLSKLPVIGIKETADPTLANYAKQLFDKLTNRINEAYLNLFSDTTFSDEVYDGINNADAILCLIEDSLKEEISKIRLKNSIFEFMNDEFEVCEDELKDLTRLYIQCIFDRNSQNDSQLFLTHILEDVFNNFSYTPTEYLSNLEKVYDDLDSVKKDYIIQSCVNMAEERCPNYTLNTEKVEWKFLLKNKDQSKLVQDLMNKVFDGDVHANNYKEIDEMDDEVIVIRIVELS